MRTAASVQNVLEKSVGARAEDTCLCLSASL